MGDDVFLSYLYCKYKGYLTLKGEKGELSEYGLLQAKLRQSYQDAVTSAIIRNNPQSLVPKNSPLAIGDLEQGAPFTHVSRTIQDCFGISVGFRRIYKFKSAFGKWGLSL